MPAAQSNQAPSAAAAAALFLVFDFGGVITANAFPGMIEYSLALFDDVMRGVAADDAAKGPTAATLTQRVAGVLRPQVRSFFSAVNKYNAFAAPDRESQFEKMEKGKITREEYCATFPQWAVRCVNGLYKPKAEKKVRSVLGMTEDAEVEAAVAVAVRIMTAFREAYDIDTVLTVLERSPLRRNVVELLDFVRCATDNGAAQREAARPAAVRFGLITNNWRGMGVDEGISMAIEHAKILAKGQTPAPPADNGDAGPSDIAVPPRQAGQWLFHAVVESHKEGARKPDPALFALSRERLLRTLPQATQDAIANPDRGAVLDCTFFDDLRPNVRGAIASNCVNHGVVVQSAASIFDGVLAALRRTGWNVLADTCHRKFSASFAATGTTADGRGPNTGEPEDTANALNMPAPPTKNILPGHLIPEKQRFSDDEMQRLLRHLAAVSPRYFPMHLRMMAEGGAPIVEYFKGGMSNPTFRITLRTGSFVLRKQPKGKLLAGAHDVRREFVIMRHLREASNGEVPVPHCLHFCEDASVLGTPFYVMKFVPGSIIRQAGLLLAQPHPDRILFGLVDALAALHKSGPPKELAAKHREPAGDAHPILRVVSTWQKQYARGNKQLAERHATDPKIEGSLDVPEFTELGSRLTSLLQSKGAIPRQAATLVHGDYKPDNMIIADINGARPRVVALLDFELAHINDPLADLGYFCLLYCLPPPRGLAGVEGIERLPPIEAVIERYCDRSGRLSGVDAAKRRAIVQVYMAQACHKLGGIVHGVVVRALLGNASDVSGGLKLRPLCEGVSMLGLGLLDEAVEGLGLAKKAGSESKL